MLKWVGIAINVIISSLNPLFLFLLNLNYEKTQLQNDTLRNAYDVSQIINTVI